MSNTEAKRRLSPKGLESALEKLGDLLNEWDIAPQDWILVSQYAYRLLGYDVKVREGHLNILVDRDKLPWDVRDALETHPPEKTRFAEQFHLFVEESNFEFDITPVAHKDVKRKLKNTIPCTLPNGMKINVQTPKGALEELEYLLSMCTDEGWGEEKGARVLPSVENLREALIKKGEEELTKLYGDLIQKYSHLKKSEVLELPKDKEKVNRITGIPASKGKAVGKVNVVLNPLKTKLFNEGEILVVPMTSPKYTPFMLKAAAIVTDEGGILCHAAIVAREMEKPCIVGTKIATRVFKDGDFVEVDAEDGVVRRIKRS